MTAVVGAAIPLVYLFYWRMGAAMSAGTQTGIAATSLLRTFGATPYYLWFAATIAPSSAFRLMRQWDIGMHFIYAPVYLVLYSYSMGSAMGFLLLSQGTIMAAIIAFWYRLGDLQNVQQQPV